MSSLRSRRERPGDSIPDGQAVKSRLLSDSEAAVEDRDRADLEDGITQKARAAREALAVLQVRLNTLPKRKELRAFRSDVDEVIRKVVALLDQLDGESH